MITATEMEAITAEVMRRFPKLEIESRCQLERDFRQRARISYKQRLINECEGAKAILEGNGGEAITN